MIDLRRASQASLLLLAFSVVKSVLALLVKSSIAKFFGSSPVTDAYFAAFTMPQQIGDFFIGGILFIVIIPVFHSRRGEAGEEEAIRDASALLNLSAVALLSATVLYFIFIPDINALLFDGFPPETLRMTNHFSRWLAPMLPLFGLSLIYTSLYRIHLDFLTPCLAALFFPLSSLAALWLLPESLGMNRLIYGNLTGNVLGLILLVAVMNRKIPWRVDNWRVWNPVTQKILSMSWPIVTAFLIGRIIPFALKNAAAGLDAPGAISLLEYALFLANSAFYFVLSPVSGAMFPIMSRQQAEEGSKAVAESFRRTLGIILYMSLPMCVVLWVESRDIVACVFMRGRFNEAEMIRCSNLLTLFSLMIVPGVLNQLIAHLFYIRHQTKLISLCRAGVTLASVPLFYVLSHRFGIYGVAAAFVAMHAGVAVVNSILLAGGIDELVKFGPLLVKTLKLVLATAAMAGIMLIAAQTVWVVGNPFIRLFFVSLAGLFSYLACSRILNLGELRFILERIPILGAFTLPSDVNKEKPSTRGRNERED